MSKDKIVLVVGDGTRPFPTELLQKIKELNLEIFTEDELTNIVKGEQKSFEIASEYKSSLNRKERRRKKK